MIVEERLTTYLHSLESADIPVLDEIEQEALADMVPIIRKETKSFLKVMLEIKRPAKILEIGTAVGFSAILMGKYSPEECHITTIENYEKRIPIARANFARAGMEQKITLLEGDALVCNIPFYHYACNPDYTSISPAGLADSCCALPCRQEAKHCRKSKGIVIGVLIKFCN